MYGGLDIVLNKSAMPNHVLNTIKILQQLEYNLDLIKFLLFV